MYSLLNLFMVQICMMKLLAARLFKVKGMHFSPFKAEKSEFDNYDDKHKTVPPSYDSDKLVMFALSTKHA